MSKDDGSGGNIYLLTGLAGLAGYMALNYLTRPIKVEHAQLPRITDKMRVQYDKKDVHYVTTPEGEKQIKIAEEGIAGLKPITVFDMFRDSVKNAGSTVALSVERDSKWVNWTWKEYYDDVMTAARAFVKLGLKPFQSVNIIGFNSPEWLIADLAAIACGAKVAGIYTTNNPDACHYITEHSEAPLVVVENEIQLNKYLKIRDRLPKLRGLIIYNAPVPQGANVEGKCKVYTWKEFMEFGRGDEEKSLQEEIEKRIKQQQPGHCCTLIYTSGTTGNPKAVMLSHDNVTWTAAATVDIFPVPKTCKDPQHLISYLPLSHIAAQILDIYGPMALTAIRGNPATTWFARPDALKGSLNDTLKTARPTVFFGVPRVFEKIEEKMRSIIGKTTGAKKHMFNFASQQGKSAGEATQLGGSGRLPRLYPLADKLIFQKIRLNLGFDRCHALYTGAAPISKETLWFFESIGLPILELFGMSECTGPHSVSLKNYRKIGSCGPIFVGCEVKVEHVNGRDKPEEGELCLRGRNIMMGYMKDVNKTREAIDDEGYLHSGDVGKVENGLLYITGRIKELLITAGGENVAPVPVEDAIKKELPAISNVMMVGDRRKYNTVLLTLRTKLDENGVSSGELAGPAKEVSSESKTVEEAKKDPKWKKYIEDGLQRVNKQAVSNASTVQKFRILPGDFSITTGELTATLKLKRNEVLQKYNDLIEEMYTEN